MAPSQISENASVFLGIAESEYRSKTELDTHFMAGTSSSTAAGRVSYFFGFLGPCLSIDTACSSSLVAFNYAVAQVRSSHTHSFAMGANSLMDEKIFVSISQAGMLSPTGRCHTFDQRANGFVRGEACGVLLLCTDDGLVGVPFAKVCGSAINQDGRSNGLTAPNGPSQVKLIREALAGAGVKGRDVEMLEAHGTGTSLGDPIEVQAVSEALGREREGRRLVMGSAKTNFGHTETAAGVLGVLKAVLCMERETVAQHLHLRQLNEYIGTGVMEGMGCVVPVESVEWKSETKRAGVSSFGFSGTNAHVVVEETKKRREEKGEEKDGGVVVVRVSGKSEAAMQSLARAYSEWMAEGEGSAAAFGRATVAGRMVMKHVQRVVGATRREMARLLVAGESNASEGDEATARARAEEEGGDEKRTAVMCRRMRLKERSFGLLLCMNALRPRLFL